MAHEDRDNRLWRTWLEILNRLGKIVTLLYVRLNGMKWECVWENRFCSVVCTISATLLREIAKCENNFDYPSIDSYLNHIQFLMFNSWFKKKGGEIALN